MVSDNGNSFLIDSATGKANAVVVNTTDVSTKSVYEALAGPHPEVAELVRWSLTTQGDFGASRSGSMFQRDRFVTPTRIFDQFKVAYDAVESDDVVSGVQESTEALAFNRVAFAAIDDDEEDIWNQVAFDIDLEARIREMWRELFTISQVYCLTWWGTKSYKVRGKTTGGVTRKKTYDNLVVPLGITILDPTKVLPVGNLMFNQEQLAYCADRTEVDMLDAAVMNDPQADPISRQIIVAKYAPPDYERRMLAKIGVNADFLYILNPRNAWRHTLTRSQYERFAHVRMKSTFEVLDLKHQLRQMDRAYLIGGPLRVDQGIYTAEGYKSIGEAKVGDKVYSVDGQLTDIIGVFPQGVLPMYRVTFTDGAEVICDDTHPWTVYRPDKRKPGRTLTLRQIMDEGLRFENGLHRHRIPIAAPLDTPAQSNLPLDPYLVGYLLGDGSLSQSIPKITCAEGEDQPWRDVLPEGVTVNQYEKRDGFCPQYGLKGSRWKHNEVTEGLRLMGLWGRIDTDKFIPSDYLWASVEQRWALLQGLCDSDGHSHQAGGVEFSTVSEKLALGVVELAQLLGGVAKISCRAEDGTKVYAPSLDNMTNVPLYRVWISVHQTEAPFRLRRKVEKWQPRKVAYVRAIHNIERIDDAEAVCIKTARDDGLFLTEGCVVTHNTNFIILVKKGTDQLPAKPEEVNQLLGQVTTVARVPILVGDHRLSVEIVTPKTDFTLSSDKWATLDSRLTTRLYNMFVVRSGSSSHGGDDSVKLAKVIARGLESRRYMLRRQLERQIVMPAVLANPALTCQPTIRFHPTRIELAFDPATAMFIQDARDRGDLSRDTYLNELDYDQEWEAIQRQRELRDFDRWFTQTNVPFSAPGPGHAVPVGPTGKPNEEPAGTSTNAPPAVSPHSHGPDGTPVALPVPTKPKSRSKKAAVPADPKSAGRNLGGRRNGGGAAPGTGQGQAAPRGRPKNT